ncbi:helix-turn-helix transcriptional regulator [Paenibacillus sp. MZ03-122A]|uniref:helix-turn-helix domain-containing protein n=1 Tax=Paenibacillus sp. MZ03-122A TaxID=2962033 RepID=UPI000F9B36D4|nr:helix-turn-helix transcriptional regulator [Paenibacillus sp. MZ03-122A]MCP3778759.1 helix-turn-helix transcriptional regulator [Paenibacillus sp. MZ03-122A]
MPILDNIQKLCRENDITVAKLEKELNFSNGSLYKWASSSPSIDKVQKVAKYFKVSFDKLYYGFELTELKRLVHYVKNGRSDEQFAVDTGVDFEELSSIALGLITEPPALDTIIKIASSNPVDHIVSEEDLVKAAGYSLEDLENIKSDDQEFQEIQTIAAHFDGEDYTDEEMQEILDYVKYIKSKRK